MRVSVFDMRTLVLKTMQIQTLITQHFPLILPHVNRYSNPRAESETEEPL